MSGPMFCDRCHCRPTMFGNLEGDDAWPLEHCNECERYLCQRCIKTDHATILDLSDLCLNCGTPIGQIDETDLRCYPKGETYRYTRHEFSFKARHRRQQGDQEKLAAWNEAAAGWGLRKGQP